MPDWGYLVENRIQTAMDGGEFSVDALVEEALGWGERLREHLDDTTWLVQAALARGALGGLEVDVDADRAGEPAVGGDGDLARDVDQVSRPDEGNIVGDRGHRLRQNDPERGESVVDC